MLRGRFRHALRGLSWVLLCLPLFGCASVNGPLDERDPLEPFNRRVDAFNRDFDEKIARPVAESYVTYVPGFVRTGVSNFFSNLDDVLVIANGLLQLKFEQAASDTMRFSVNTVLGLFGLVDIATSAGLPKHQEDFGQTLGAWGVGPGPYLVLPFLGPSTVRDSIGLYADARIDPMWELGDNETQIALGTARAVDLRASLLGATRVLEEAALDPYSFTRDAYLQRRLSLVYDGQPPRESFDDFDDDFVLPPDESPPPAVPD